MNNREEQQVLNIFQELLNKYDKQGARKLEMVILVSLFGKQLRFLILVNHFLF